MDAGGRAAVVTGASRGIGEATARALARDGYGVTLAARSADRLAEIAADITADGGTAEAVPTDVADPEALEVLVEAAVARFGRLDVLVNNAGVLPAATRSERMDLATWQQALDINLTGPWWLANRARDAMVETGGGVVVNVGSTAASYPSVGFAAYNASKAALTMLTRTLALEWARDDIRVVGVAPGKVDTVMVEPILEYVAQQGLAPNPLDRVGAPSEVAELIAFLVSERAAFVTGTTVVVDGGELLEH